MPKLTIWQFTSDIFDHLLLVKPSSAKQWEYIEHILLKLLLKNINLLKLTQKKLEPYSPNLQNSYS